MNCTKESNNVSRGREGVSNGRKKNGRKAPGYQNGEKGEVPAGINRALRRLRARNLPAGLDAARKKEGGGTTRGKRFGTNEGNGTDLTNGQRLDTGRSFEGEGEGKAGPGGIGANKQSGTKDSSGIPENETGVQHQRKLGKV